MTRKFIYSILCCVAVLLVACTHEEDNKINLSVKGGPVNVTAENAGVQTIAIETNTTWTATVSGGSWLTIAPMSGTGNHTITIAAADNNSKDQRTATITITANDKNESVSVTQAGLGQAIPEKGGIITGDDANNCPYTNTIVLSTTAIPGATTYQWYCNGTLVGNTTALTYTTSSTPGTFAYTVAGKNAVGEGEPGPEKRITITECELPADADVIQGDDGNTCPKNTVDLTIDPIDNAVSYQWYKNGVAISGAVAASYTVTATGTYSVAGVNAAGEGVKSPEKVVTLISCSSAFVRELEGMWDVTELYIASGQAYNNDHVLTISGLSPTSIQIQGWNAEEDEDVIVATVDTVARTLTIETQEIIPTWNSTYRTFISPMAASTYCDNYGKTFPVTEVKTESGHLTITLVGGAYTVTVGDEPFIASYVVIGTDASLVCAGGFGFAAGTKWVKQDANPAPKKSVAPKSIRAKGTKKIVSSEPALRTYKK